MDNDDIIIHTRQALPKRIPGRFWLLNFKS